MQGPRLYRFFNYEMPVYLPAPTGGWNPDANPWELPITEATQLDNFLIRPGKIVMRGAMSVAADFSSIAPLNLAGAVVTPNGILVSRFNAQNCEPWNSPLLRPTNLQLASGKTAGYWIPTGTLPQTPASFTFTDADHIPGPRSIVFYGNTYGISYDSVSAPVQDSGANYYIKPLSVYHLSGSGAPTVTTHTTAPHGAFDIIGYQSRIWLLGGIDTPGALTAHEPTTVYFTNPLTALSAASDWQDPVTGLTNKIVMDGDTQDYGVGFGVVRNGLIILRRNSVYLLRGTTTANYTLIPLSKSVGCVDARSIVSTDTGVYFMSLRGLMFTNGSTVVNVSGPLMYTLQAAVKQEQIELGLLSGTFSGAYVTCAQLSSGPILVSMGFGNGSGFYGGTLLSAMYDPTVGRGGVWTRLTSNLWQSDSSQLGTNYYAGQLFVSHAPVNLVAIGDKYVTAIEDQRNTISINDPNSFGLCDALPSGVNRYVSIPAVWQTPIPAITVANKRVIALARRYYFDYNFGATNHDFGVGWSLQPTDAQGNSLDSLQTVPSDTGVSAVTGPVSGVSVIPSRLIQRFNQDWFKEIQDCTFTVSWSVAAAANLPTQVLAEIYGLGVEFQRSRDLRTAT